VARRAAETQGGAEQKSARFEKPPLRRLELRFGAFALWFGRVDFVGGGVAGAFEGAPEIPTGDGAIRAPAVAEGEEFLGTGHVFLAVGDGPAFFYAEIVNGKNVGAAEAEDQKHFDGPDADAADGDEALDEFLVGEFQGFVVGRNDAGKGFAGEILHGEDFCAGKAGFAKRGFAKLEDFLGCGDAAIGTESFDPIEDRGGGFAGDGLVGNGFEEGFIGILGGFHLGLEGWSHADEFGEAVVNGGEMGECGGEIERELGRHGEID
jgi:hypothetical protein